MQGVYKNIGEYNPSRKSNVLIAVDDMIADTISNKKLNTVVSELFVRERNLNISTVFITQPYFRVLKDVRLNSTCFFIIKLSNKWELQQIAKQYNCKTIRSFSYW